MFLFHFSEFIYLLCVCLFLSSGLAESVFTQWTIFLASELFL